MISDKNSIDSLKINRTEERMVLVPFEKTSANVYSPLERLCRDEALTNTRRNSIKALGEISEIISLTTYVQNILKTDLYEIFIPAMEKVLPPGRLAMNHAMALVIT